MMGTMGKQAIEEQWLHQSEAAREEAAKLPYGKQRDDLLRTARRLRTVSQINQWLSSPELQPPK
jgi:hypothetical protein